MPGNDAVEFKDAGKQHGKDQHRQQVRQQRQWHDLQRRHRNHIQPDIGQDRPGSGIIGSKQRIVRQRGQHLETRDMVVKIDERQHRGDDQRQQPQRQRQYGRRPTHSVAPSGRRCRQGWRCPCDHSTFCARLHKIP